MWTRVTSRLWLKAASNRRYPLSEVAEALRYVGEGPQGNVAITVEHAKET